MKLKLKNLNKIGIMSEAVRNFVTRKKKAFIEAYLADVKRNQTAAAIAAGYSEKGAAQAASRLMNDTEVAAAIADRERELHEQNTAKADEVIELLTAVMRGEEVETLPIFVGDGEQKFKDGKPSARDRLKAAELLGKYYALFTDKVQTEGNDVVIIKDDIPRSNAERSGDNAETD